MPLFRIAQLGYICILDQESSCFRQVSSSKKRTRCLGFSWLSNGDFEFNLEKNFKVFLLWQ